MHERSESFQTIPLTATEAMGEPALVRHRVQRERMVPAEDRMEDTFRIPIVATLVFVITMIAIFYLGRIVAGYYEPVIMNGQVEFVGRRS
ncbi:MAG: hypothetical protein O3C45_01595 [Bacteroidetes bacterium]|nr:hypothetical protein [Bacteroidota bacterium]MDA0873731.1 hypothetical protein [Bacteroidota bacterium]